MIIVDHVWSVCEECDVNIVFSKSQLHKATFAERVTYRKGRAADRAADRNRLRKRFPQVSFESEDDNEWMSSTALKFRQWCKYESWTMCSTCLRLIKVPLRPYHLRDRKHVPTLESQCTSCCRGVRYSSLKPQDVPAMLKKLSPEIINALRPLEIDQGPVQRNHHGYRVHTRMTTFRWKRIDVEDAITTLSRKINYKAFAVFRYLMENEDSSYKDFIVRHRAELLAVANGQKKQGRVLPRGFIESNGIECCLWPHLYWSTAMCETFVRHQDIRRVQRLHRHRQGQRSDTSSSNSCESSASSHCDREPPEIDRAHFSDRSSLKQSFLAKIFSGIIDYGVQYELFQFVYDLWLWTTVASAKQKSSVPLRITLSGRPYSPEYWKRKHAGLLDLQRQLGYPTLFLTIAPYEWSFPHHVWVRDELDKAFRNRLHLPAAETLHAAHVMSQTVTNYICDFTQSHKWTHHVLRNEFNAGNVVVSYFLRIEFQDGKRKRHIRGVPRSYHGRGTSHFHALIWLKEVQTSTLRSAVSVTMQNLDTPMRSLVRGS